LQRSTSDRRAWPVYHCVQHCANEAARRAGPSATADTCLVTSKSVYIAITMKGHFAYNSPYSLNGFAQNSEKVRNHCGISHATQKNGIQGFRQTAPKSGRTRCFFLLTQQRGTSCPARISTIPGTTDVHQCPGSYSPIKSKFLHWGFCRPQDYKKNETPFLFSLCFLDSSLIS